MYFQIINKVLYTDMRPELSTDPQRCPPPLRQLLEQCVSKQPERRPTATQVLERLRAISRDLREREAAYDRAVMDALV